MKELSTAELRLAIEALQTVYRNNCDAYPNGFVDKVDYQVLIGKLTIEWAGRD